MRENRAWITNTALLLAVSQWIWGAPTLAKGRDLSTLYWRRASETLCSGSGFDPAPSARPHPKHIELSYSGTRPSQGRVLFAPMSLGAKTHFAELEAGGVFRLRNPATGKIERQVSLPFLRASTVIDMDSDGERLIFLTDDQRLWKVDDLDRLEETTRSVPIWRWVLGEVETDGEPYRIRFADNSRIEIDFESGRRWAGDPFQFPAVGLFSRDPEWGGKHAFDESAVLPRVLRAQDGARTLRVPRTAKTPLEIEDARDPDRVIRVAGFPVAPQAAGFNRDGSLFFLQFNDRVEVRDSRDGQELGSIATASLGTILEAIVSASFISKDEISVVSRTEGTGGLDSKFIYSRFQIPKRGTVLVDEQFLLEGRHGPSKIKITSLLSRLDRQKKESGKSEPSLLPKNPKQRIALHEILSHALHNAFQHGKFEAASDSVRAGLWGASLRVQHLLHENQLIFQITQPKAVNFPKSLLGREFYPGDQIKIPLQAREGYVGKGIAVKESLQRLQELPVGSSLFWEDLGTAIRFTLRLAVLNS